jgi:VWFA-related protein
MKKPCISFYILAGIAFVLCAFGAAQFQGLDYSEKVLYPGVSNKLVLLDARVTDEKGNHVPGLKPEDFQIYQDNRLQNISEIHEIQSDKTNDDPRTIVFIIDDLGLSREKFSQAKTALKYFADKIMQPNDMVGLARTAGGGFIFQPLTSESDTLRNAVERWQWSLAAARPLDNYRGIQVVSSSFIQSCSGTT